MSILDGLFESEDEVLELYRQVGERLPDFLNEQELAKSPLYQAMARGICIADALQIAPEKLDALYRVAMNRMKAGDYANARAIYLTLSQLKPLDERYSYGMATAFQLEGRYKAAIGLYQYYLSLSPECPQARLRIGECLMGAGEIDAALDLFRSALARATEQGAADAVRHAEAMIAACQKKMPAAAQ